MELAREANLDEGTRLFREGSQADRFWIVRSGAVNLDVHVSVRHAAVIETFGTGELVGYSWLFKPYVWRLTAEAMAPVRAHEFDAVRIRALIDADTAFGSALGHWVGEVLAHRLQAARVRVLDLYAPYGSGSSL